MLDELNRRAGALKIDDLDWSVKPRPMARDEEIAIVQYFKNMAGIERFAKALFEEQGNIVSDPTLKKIFRTFVVDEERHAQVADRLAEHYNVHRFQEYKASPELERFRPYFLNALSYLSAEIANAYITGGELLLDVALLRSLNDYVHDDMSARAMELINRDESRHIAMDYYMTEFYASDAYQAWLAQQPKKSVAHQAKAWGSFAGVLIAAAPFFKSSSSRWRASTPAASACAKRSSACSSSATARMSPRGRFIAS